jgi:hypothetical protein
MGVLKRRRMDAGFSPELQFPTDYQNGDIDYQAMNYLLTPGLPDGLFSNQKSKFG